MCGIAGFVFRKGGSHQPPVPAILNQLRHRGPDDHGYVAYSERGLKIGRDWTDPGGDPEVIFLHRRLSILDLSDAGSQPMGTRDGSANIPRLCDQIICLSSLRMGPYYFFPAPLDEINLDRDNYGLGCAFSLT
jgi:hypothetical protein